MDAKMIALAIGKLSDEVEQLKEQNREMMLQIKALKIKTPNQETPPVSLHGSEPEFITLKQVREILKMSRNSVYQMIENELIRPVRMTKRTIRYVKSEILALTKNLSHGK